MPIQLQLESGALIGGGGAAFKAANVHAKPLDYGTLGHYRCVAFAPLVVSQAAPSRLFTLRNVGSNLIVPTLIEVEALAIGDVSPEQQLWISMHSCTGFTLSDTISTSTPAAMVLRASGMSAAPGGAELRAITPAGAVGGMTGWVATKDTAPHSYFVSWISSASAERVARVKRFVDPSDQAIHPPVYAANQGFVIENSVVGSSSSNSVYLFVTVAWAEVMAY